MIDDPYCCFCGKRHEYVKILVKSDTGEHICDECIELAAEIVQKKRIEDMEQRMKND